ncbi:MAG: nitronate monooxygenase [Acidimicrobiia bacterium]|nr:nitronate monooxygenase [Acidimicrobiia bacterium]MDH4348634.1 nitronate monooxygenase [Gemmatimonadota bacterium]
MTATLHTRFTDMFGLRYPVMAAPMAFHSGSTLAAAVSAAGAMGSFSGTHPFKDPDWILTEIATVQTATSQPFAVGFITPFLPFTEALFDAALTTRPTVVAFSFGDPGPWAAKARAAGSRVICQVQTYNDAALAVAAGADVLVAQGTEAGGHTGTMGLLPLLTGIVARYPDVPVLAAGGIADGRSLAAALIAGADGVSLGTALLATPEAVEVHQLRKQLIIDSDGSDTIFTRVYDIASGLPWPAGIGERVRRNRFTDEWTERETELRAKPNKPPLSTNPFETTPDPDTDSILYGQSAGFVNTIRPAADVIHSLCDDADAILRTRPNSLLR